MFAIAICLLHMGCEVFLRSKTLVIPIQIILADTEVIVKNEMLHTIKGQFGVWLLGPFICAHLRAYHDPDQAKKFLYPVIEQLKTHGIGSISEIFDGDNPFSPRGCIAQAWSVAEILRVWTEINQYKD